ncbi:MAG: hypothetical protein HRU13_08315, partial [Phycisphaerales bacterium]|nr:hypothetical protein [Phycisphaerales bacterium]
MLRTASLIPLAAASGIASAQPAISIQIDEPVLLPGESTTVTLLAGFDPALFAMAGVATDLVTSVGSEGWSDAMRVAPMDG